MFLEGEAIGGGVSPFHFALGMEFHIAEMLAVLIGGKQIAEGLHGQVVDVLTKFAAKCPQGLNGAGAGDSGFVRVQHAGFHLVIHAGDQSRVLFDVHIEADMQFHASGGSGGEGHGHDTGFIVHSARHDHGRAAVRGVGASKSAGTVIFGHGFAIHIHADAIVLHGIGHTVLVGGSKGVRGSGVVTGAEFFAAIHGAVHAAIVEVDNVTFLEIAESGTSNALHADELRLVEVTGHESHHVGGDSLKPYGKHEGHETVAHEDAFSGGHVGTFKDAAKSDFSGADQHGVFAGLMTGRQHVIRREMPVLHFVALKCAGVNGGDHSTVFRALIESALDSTFKDHVALFALALGRGGEEPVFRAERLHKGVTHDRGPASAVRNLLVERILLAHLSASPFENCFFQRWSPGFVRSVAEKKVAGQKKPYRYGRCGR